MGKNRLIRIALADDNSVVREGLRAIISNETDIQIVAEACNWAQAIEQILSIGRTSRS